MAYLFDYLRILCAISVAFYHIGIFNNFPVDLGSAVAILFAISSFLMMTKSKEQINIQFLLKRLFRLLSLYWIITLVLFAAVKILPNIFNSMSLANEINFQNFVKSMFLIPYYKTGSSGVLAVRPIVGPGWTLYYDVLFAIIFYLSSKINYKFRGLFVGIVLSVLIVVGLIFNINNPFAQIYLSYIWIFYLSGIAAFYVKVILNRKTKINELPKILLIPLIIDLILIFVVTNYFVKAALVLILIFISSNIKTSPSPKPIMYWSSLSYSFYLIHYFIIVVFEKLFGSISIFNFKNIALSIAVILIGYLIAIIEYEILEKRLFKKVENAILKD